MWGLTPQKSKSDPFIRGKNLTWQQYEILSAVERGLTGEAPRRISVASGHGIGKSAVLSWLLLWYLFCFKDAQVPCTAPTADQIYDVLWKEVAKWLGKMPDQIRAVYEWSTTYVRIKQRPETWFARAKTARKESPEALAGIHGDYVMMLVDEASGVDDVIYRTAEGALTSGNIFVVLISNPTRLIGYFHDTHYGDKQNWQTLQFSSLDSPIVEQQYVDRIKDQHGEDSDEYRIRVLGQFPKEDAVDEQGYVPLLTQSDIRFAPETPFNKDIRLGVDPAGEGDDESVWVLRDNFKAKIIAREKVSTPKGIAQRTLSIMELYKIPPQAVYIDSFGVGANALQQLAASSYELKILDQKVRYMAVVTGVNAGDKPDDDERYLNRRAEMYYRIKDWIRQGGEFIQDDGWDELLTIRYRPELSGKLKIMGKHDMRKLGYKSPNCFVAGTLILTPNGYTPIEQLKVGDKVITPYGSRTILKTWDRDAMVIVKRFGNKHLIGTPDHKIYTPNGKKKLVDMKNGDIIGSDTLTNLLKWRFHNLFNSKARNTGFSTTKDTTLVMNTVIPNIPGDVRKSSFTIRYGNTTIKPKSQVDTASTILTEILSIIRLKTWLWWSGGHTPENICLFILKTKSTGKTTEKYSIVYDQKRQSGINQNRLNRFIAGLVNCLGKIANQLKRYVLNVMSRLTPTDQKSLNSALSRAQCGMPIGTDIKQPSVDVKCVATSLPTTNTDNSYIVPVSAELSAGVQRVYNITLDYDNAYYANGILVFNCADALSLTFMDDITYTTKHFRTNDKPEDRFGLFAEV